MPFTEYHLLAWVHLSQHGSAEAFGELYEALFDDLYRYLCVKVRPDDREDLCTDIFLKTWENIGQYKAQRNVSFRSWFFRIAHNAVIDYYRKRRDITPIDEALQVEDHSARASPERETDRTLGQEYLLTLLSRLKPEYRQVVTMKYLNELGNAEIAEIMGKSETAVRILLHRTLKQLKGMVTGKKWD